MLTQVLLTSFDFPLPRVCSLASILPFLLARQDTDLERAVRMGCGASSEAKPVRRVCKGVQSGGVGVNKRMLQSEIDTVLRTLIAGVVVITSCGVSQIDRRLSHMTVAGPATVPFTHGCGP